MRRLILPVIFLGLPFAEIAGFILVGRWLGVWPTLLLIILTSLLGATLLRIQGFGILRRLQQENGAMGGRQVMHGAMIFVAGILLILPGFITDTIGLLLFIPAVREMGWKLFRDRIVVFSNMRGAGPSAAGSSPRGSRQDGVIELDDTEFSRNDDDRRFVRKKDD